MDTAPGAHWVCSLPAPAASRPGWTKTVEVGRRQGVQARCDQLTAQPMASAMQCHLNLQVRLFISMFMAPKPAYRRGKRKGGEQRIRSEIERWVGRRGGGQPNPRYETKIQGKDEDRESVQQTTSGIGHRIK